MTQNTLKKRYIEAAYDICEREGREAVTIRRLARELKRNPALLYRCFRGQDELFIYLSIRSLRPYLTDVTELIKTKPGTREFFLKTWEYFARHSFEKPKAFQQLFFQETDYHITYCLEDYYQMFPDDFPELDDHLKKIFLSGRLDDRNYFVIKELAEEEHIAEPEVQRISDMVDQLYKGYLKDFIDGTRKSSDTADVAGAVRDFLADIIWILDHVKKEECQDELIAEITE